MTLDPSTEAPGAANGHPQLGSVHKNGDRRFGIAGARSQTLADRGTPMLSSLYHSTVTEHVQAVRVGDELRVEWNGTHWWASSSSGLVGRLSWSKGLRADATRVREGRSPYDFDSGTLLVQSVTVDQEGAVVDCGGYVVPDDHDPSEWSESTPDESERELRITLASEPPTVAAQPPAPRSLLRRLLGRDR